MTKTDDDAIAARISAGKTDDLVSLLEDADAVAALTREQQLELAKHRSVDVPRALAKRAAALHEDTQRELAKSKIFTARRELVKNGGLALPADLLDTLANDEDGAVRNLVSKARGETATKTPKAKKPASTAKRRHAGEGFAAKPRAKLLEFLNGDDVKDLEPLAQVQLAQHRSVEVPRALARHAPALHEDAQRALAESPIFMARRELVRTAGAELPEDVLAALSEDPDSVVRARVLRVWTPDEDNLPESIRLRREELAANIEQIRSASTLDDVDVDALLRKRDERLLAELADNTAVVTTLSPDRQVALAKHRSISVPRTLARQSALLCDEAINELAQSPVFTARRGLARYGLDRLNQEQLDLLARDEDEVVRKLVADRMDASEARVLVADLSDAELLDQAKDGNPEAISQLGVLAWTRGNLDEAAMWLEQAAGLGDAQAMLDLETMALERGDELMAKHWLKMAADAGHVGAAYRYEAEPRQDPDYTGMDLRDLDFANQDLARASFRRANLEGVDFSGSTLTRADFTGAILTNADFTGAHVNAADFTNAQAEGADFTDAKAARALFRYSKLAGAVFTNASIRDADFMGTNLEDTELDGVDADGAMQFGANWDMELSNGDFTNRVLLDRDFTEIAVTGGKFRHAQLDGSSFVSLDLTGASFINASLVGVDFTNANLTNADFTGAILINATLDGATLDGADFQKAILTKDEFIRTRSDFYVGEALDMINELDRLTGGEGDDGYSERADEIESMLAEADPYANVEDADFGSADISTAKMSQAWLSDRA